MNSRKKIFQIKEYPYKRGAAIMSKYRKRNPRHRGVPETQLFACFIFDFFISYVNLIYQLCYLLIVLCVNLTLVILDLTQSTVKLEFIVDLVSKVRIDRFFGN